MNCGVFFFNRVLKCAIHLGQLRRLGLFGLFLCSVCLSLAEKNAFSDSTRVLPKGLAILEDARLFEALETLEQLPSGKSLLQKSYLLWKTTNLYDVVGHLKWDMVSRTDTVLTRHFNPQSGVESVEREVTIFLKRQQPQIDLVLDLAHEMVHATARPNFDPYDPRLTAGKYIWNTLEGEGGEVDAVVQECRVGLDLMSRLGEKIQRCQTYFDQAYSEKPGPLGKSIDREKIRKEFYQVGEWYPPLKKRLGTELSLFPLLSGNPIQLYSSTGHAPYPVALQKEFDELTEMACDNSRKRVRSVSSIQLLAYGETKPSERKSLNSSSPSRELNEDFAQQAQQKDARFFISQRCQ